VGRPSGACRAACGSLLIAGACVPPGRDPQDAVMAGQQRTADAGRPRTIIAATAIVGSPRSSCRGRLGPLHGEPLRRPPAGRCPWPWQWDEHPTVQQAGPADECAHNDDRTGQREVELYLLSAPLGAPAQLANVLAQAWGALDDPAAADLERCGHAPLGDPAKQAALGQQLTHDLIVIAAVQVHGAWLTEGPHLVQDAQGVQGCTQQGAVVAAGRCSYHAKWDARGVGGHRARGRACRGRRAGAGHLAAGCFGDAPVDASSERSRPLMRS
jgi:hypothetical protein